MKKLLLVASLVLASTSAFAGLVNKGGGVVCDTKNHFCVDSQGVSNAYSKQYYGEKGEAMALKAGASGSSWIIFSNGVSCKFDARECTVSKNSIKLDQAITKAIFN